MAQRLVTVQELFQQFDALLDFVCADEPDGNGLVGNEVVVGRHDGEAVVIVPHARLVAIRLALGTYRQQFRASNTDKLKLPD